MLRTVKAQIKSTHRLSPKKLVTKFVPLARPYGIYPRWSIKPGRKSGATNTALLNEHTSLGKAGSMEVKLAQTAREVKKAQRLRYKVFYKEMSAVADARTLVRRRDEDGFDPICDHLLVLDHHAETKGFRRRTKPKVVGTYRLMRQDVADAHHGFYTADEFEIDDLIARKPDLNFLELGRSCVLKPYRDKRTVELLWAGIYNYFVMHGVDVMIGCASLEGTDPDELATSLSFLHHHARAPEEWRVRACKDRYVEMNRIPKDELNMKKALHGLPPLLKGYLRIGCYIGDGAVVDHQFGTTDVLIIMPISNIHPRYISHYGDRQRYAS